MTKDAAIKEARIGAKLKGGTWYVTRKGSSYDAVPADFYTKRKHGGIAETIDLDAEKIVASRLISLERSTFASIIRQKEAMAKEEEQSIESQLGGATEDDIPMDETPITVPFKAQPLTIDITPEGCKTPEGAARVKEAMEAFDNSAAGLANATMQFLDEHSALLKAIFRGEARKSEYGDVLEDLHQLEALAGARRRAQERFLAAVGGHDTKEASK